MSDPTLPEPTQPLPLEPEAPATSARPRRAAVLALVAVLLVVVLAGGAWAIWKLLDGGGPQPDEALPASTVALVSIDLDPSASQKIEAFQTLRKFPALKKSLGLDSGDDLRTYIFDKALGHDRCADATFSRSVAPWIGKRVGLALVDLGGRSPAPAIALAVSDKTKAAQGFAQVLDCAGLDDEVGFVVGDDYLIASDSRAHATAIREAGIKRPLSQDAAYQRRTEAVGDRGVVSFYVAKRAGDLASGALTGLGDQLSGGSTDLFGLSSGAPGCGGDPVTTLTQQLTGFSGLAGTVRFAGGGMELSVVGTGGGAHPSPGVGRQVSRLPADSSLVLGVAVPADSGRSLMTSLGKLDCTAGRGTSTGGSPAEQFTRTTGLALPQDVTDILGSALTLTIGGDVPRHLDQLDDPSELPIAVVVHGDGPRISDLVAKVERHLGGTLADLGIETKVSADRLVLTPSQAYAAQLARDGGLGEERAFKDAVPHAADASFVFYVNFRSRLRDALVQLVADEGGRPSEVRAARENTDPLEALGLSAWRQGAESHFLLKVTTR